MVSLEMRNTLLVKIIIEIWSYSYSIAQLGLPDHGPYHNYISNIHDEYLQQKW